MEQALSRPDDWSAYRDEAWAGKLPGRHGLQPRVLHLFRQLGRNPHSVPSSNVVFVRSRREHDLRSEKEDLLAGCWPIHQAVIEQLSVRTVLCFGHTAGSWAAKAMGATKVEEFVEPNKRGWRSHAYLNQEGRMVVALTHPSIAKWNNPSSDPTKWVRRIVDRAV